MVLTLEDIGIEKKPTVEANRHVVEVLEWQWLGECTYKHMATAHSKEARAKIRNYASINGTASARRHYKKELGDVTESTAHK